MNSAIYYSTYVADSSMSELNYKLLDEIRELKPETAFEFGCGTGKNISYLTKKGGIKCTGLDISMMNIIQAHCRFDLPAIMKGDESNLANLTNFDVVFTVSVLDHIADVKGIVANLQRIATKAVFLAETQHHSPETHYYGHNYEEFGFKDIGYKYLSEKPEGDGNTYKIWKWQKGYYHMGESSNSFVNDDLA